MGNASCAAKAEVDARDRAEGGIICDLSPEFIAVEGRMLGHSGIPIEQFIVQNIQVSEQGDYIRTYEVGMPLDEQKKQVLIMIHGYGAQSIIFWKVMKPLAEKYHLILVDILGMGASSRPEFNITDPHEAVNFLIGWLEIWR